MKILGVFKVCLLSLGERTVPGRKHWPLAATPSRALQTSPAGVKSADNNMNETIKSVLNKKVELFAYKNAASLATLYCCFHGCCFTELVYCIPPPAPAAKLHKTLYLKVYSSHLTNATITSIFIPLTSSMVKTTTLFFPFSTFL